MTILSGYILDLSGKPVKGASVTSNSLKAQEFNSNGILRIPSVTVHTDLEGFFSINLLEGLVVDILIPSINFRRTLTVPATNSNLFTIE